MGWAVSAVWFAFSIEDIVSAITLLVVNGGGQSFLLFLALAFVVNTSGLVTLLSRNTRDYVASRIR